jgi:hypothetical protein
MVCSDGLHIALEIFHKHATGNFKVDATRRSGIAIAEFRAEDVLNMEAGAMLENLQVRVKMCDDCLLDYAFEWSQKCYVDELQSLQLNLQEIEDGYENWWSGELVKAAKLKSDELWNLEIIRRISLLRFSFDWIDFSLDEESDVLQHNDKMIENGYWSAWVYHLYSERKTDQEIKDSGIFNWLAFEYFLKRNPIAVKNRTFHFLNDHVKKNLASRSLKRKRFAVFGYV